MADSITWTSAIFVSGASNEKINRYDSIMDKIVLQIKWLDPDQNNDLNLPSYETPGSAGMDVEAAVTETVELAPGEIKLIPTGLSAAIPEGYEIQVRPRSGLAIKYGVTLINSPGTIDSDYRGEIRIGLINHGSLLFKVNRGDRIAQLIVSPVVKASLNIAERLSSTQRGSGGFGHTGV